MLRQDSSKWKGPIAAELLPSVPATGRNGLAATLAMRSAAMRHALDRLVAYAPLDSVLIFLEGESGTGKTTMGRHVHSLSHRSLGPFVEANLATMDDALASSELFGHVKGAFTGATTTRPGLVSAANGGTLFLDELGKASKAVQYKLLSLLESGMVRPVGADWDVPVDVRIIAAANESVEALVVAGQMCEELVPRLGLFRVTLPRLQDRREDIPVLVGLMVTRHAHAYGYHERPEVSPDLIDALQNADWPDNLRRLDAVVQRILADAHLSPVLGLAHCKDDLKYLRTVTLRGPRARAITPEQARRRVAEAGSISQAARDVGVARSTIQRQMRRDGAP